MVAIILAGGVPSADHPLYLYSQGNPKALIEINGRPMLALVVDALLGARLIDQVLVVGLPEGIKLEHPLEEKIVYLKDQGTLVKNGVAGLKWVREHRPETEIVIGCSSDIPHLRSEMVDEMLAYCQPYEALLYYGVVSKSVLEARYPGAKRTYIHFAPQRPIAPADIFVSRVEIVDTDHQLWEKLTQARKHPLQVARLVGFGTVLKLLFGRLTLEEAAMTAGRLLGSPIPLGIYESSFAEIAMDGDKPHQIELLRQSFN